MGGTLFLAHRVPYPPDRGDKIRGWHLLRHMAARGPVHLVTFADDPADLGHDAVLGEVCASHHVTWRGKPQWRAGLEALASGRPISVAAFADAGVAERVRAVLAREAIDTIFVFSGQMAQYLPTVTDARIVMDFCDVDSAKFTSYAAAGTPPMAWVMAREARLLGAFEHEIAARVDASLFVSEAEAALFRAGGAAPRVTVVENGIDTAFFDPAGAFDRSAAVPGVTFTGQMDYAPNVEAACWFAGEVMPRLAARGIDLPFNIVGRAPAKAVRALAGEWVRVTGAVADVRPWLAAAPVVVAPLLTARGVQNKVLEAMALARPIVASTVAAEGIEHRGTLSVAGDADAFAERILALLADRDAAAAQGRAARACVEDRYGWAARLAALDAVLDRPVERRVAA
ncbi:glycosyl transferase family 1 [Sphingomonas spermidinifaciens]|uniref:Glycosyl transferase family 1 n=1 Tax=Sphingomonas spermidinifaciens TaxID=1141889 RepID=A0A2A4B6K1_9SPHN|nr:TIGR03087 family PEP-CTERM/XrtA system glycosyltransferase [Sphingomonas spermidinifaciens]PCD03555.1 glycosyl transferase family 1 [Sphingomonas spermidinifaciens]